MEMVDGLAAVIAGVNDYAVALVETFVASDSGCGPEQVTQQGWVMCAGFGERDDVFSRRDENVHGRLWVDVGEGVTLVVLVDGGGWDASIDDFAE